MSSGEINPVGSRQLGNVMARLQEFSGAHTEYHKAAGTPPPPGLELGHFKTAEAIFTIISGRVGSEEQPVRSWVIGRLDRSLAGVSGLDTYFTYDEQGLPDSATTGLDTPPARLGLDMLGVAIDESDALISQPPAATKELSLYGDLHPVFTPIVGGLDSQFHPATPAPDSVVGIFPTDTTLDEISQINQPASDVLRAVAGLSPDNRLVTNFASAAEAEAGQEETRQLHDTVQSLVETIRQGGGQPEKYNYSFDLPDGRKGFIRQGAMRYSEGSWLIAEHVDPPSAIADRRPASNETYAVDILNEAMTEGVRFVVDPAAELTSREPLDAEDTAQIQSRLGSRDNTIFRGHLSGHIRYLEDSEIEPLRLTLDHLRTD